MATLVHLPTVLVHYLASSFLVDRDVIQFGRTNHIILKQLQTYSWRRLLTFTQAYQTHHRQQAAGACVVAVTSSQVKLEDANSTLPTSSTTPFYPTIGRMGRVGIALAELVDEHGRLDELHQMKHIKELRMYDRKSSNGFELPPNLHTLKLMHFYNTRLPVIELHQWNYPTSLRVLYTSSFPCSNQTRMVWPATLTELGVSIQRGDMAPLGQLPDGLKILSLMMAHPQDLTQLQFPNSITHLTWNISYRSEQSLDCIHFPLDLQKLNLILMDYSHPLWSWSVPNSCRDLSIRLEHSGNVKDVPVFPQLFVPDGVINFRLDGRGSVVRMMRLPSSLIMSDIHLPCLSHLVSLIQLESSSPTSSSADSIPFTPHVLPSSLLHLTLDGIWSDCRFINDSTSLIDLKMIASRWQYVEVVHEQLLPKHLKRLTLDALTIDCVLLFNLKLPPGLESFTIFEQNTGGSFSHKLPRLPSSLTHLSIGRIHYLDFFLNTRQPLPPSLQLLEFHLAPLPNKSIPFDERTKQLRQGLMNSRPGLSLPSDCVVQFHPTLDTCSTAKKKEMIAKKNSRTPNYESHDPEPPTPNRDALISELHPVGDINADDHPLGRERH